MRTLLLGLIGAATFAPLVVMAADPGPAGGFSVIFLAVHGRRIDTIAYDFTGDGRPDILNTSIDFDVDPPVRWFALHPQIQGGTYPEKPAQIWSVEPRCCSLMFGDVLPGGGIELCFIAPDGVYAYPAANGGVAEEPIKLLHTRTYFAHPTNRSLPVWSWAGDLSKDGLHDLIVPAPDGYKIYFQTEPGKFGRVSMLESEMRNKTLAVRRQAAWSDMLAAFFTYGEELPRITPIDLDGDGYVDLVSIDGNTVSSWRQAKPLEFHSTGRGWHSKNNVLALEEKTQKDVVNLSSVVFADINADRNTDLIVTKIYGEVGLFDSIKTNIILCYGNGKGGFTADAVINIDGVSNDPQIVDMNGDGRLDLMTSRLRTDIINKALEGFVLGDIRIDYEVFQFDPSNNKPRPEAVYSYPVAVTFKDIKEKGAASRPMMNVTGDFSGDGRPDQIRLDPKTDSIEFHEGRDTARGNIDFTPTPWQIYKPERNPKALIVYDVNGDRLADLLMLYSGQVGILLSTKK